MSDEPVPEEGQEHSFLAEDESATLHWTGTLHEGDEEFGAEFVATDDRLIYSLGEGHFRDVGFHHVESVEVTTDVETHRSGTDPDALKGIGVVLALGGLAVLYFVGSGGFAVLAGLGLVGGGIYAYWYANEHYDELADTVEVTEQEVYHVVLRTSATSPFTVPIYLETAENVGPELSRLVQEAE